MAAIGTSDVVHVRSGVDVTRLPLTAEEGFIFTRVERACPVQEVVLTTGLPEARVLAAVTRLVQLGALGMGPEQSKGDAAEDEDPLTEELISEDVDLTAQQRLRIVDVDRLCQRGNHYEVLGVRRHAPSGEIKKGYFDLSREFHPDAYFRKSLGSFQPRVERIFKRLKVAYEVLSDPAARGPYDASLPAEGAAAPRANTDWMDERRRAERDERRLRRNPLLERVQRAKRHLAKAQEYLEQGDVARMNNELTLAAALDPQNALVREIRNKVEERVADNRRAQMMRILLQLVKQRMDESMVAENLTETLGSEVVTPEFCAQLAQVLVDGGFLKLARTAADAGLKLNPEHVQCLEAGVDAYEKAGLTLNAVRMMELLQRKHPSPAREDRLKRLRKAERR